MSPSPAPLLLSRRSDRFPASRGFTLIELLTVVAIIGILATITFNVMGGVQRHSMTTRTQAELTGIGTALDQFKLQYGDYPRTDKAADLFAALTGKKGPTLNTISGKIFLANLTKYNLSNSTLDANGNYADGTVLLDPWGIEYHYVYKPAAAPVASWKNPSYVLYSGGPDEKITDAMVDATGKLTDAANAAIENLDNIYANHP